MKPGGVIRRADKSWKATRRDDSSRWIEDRWIQTVQSIESRLWSSIEVCAIFWTHKAPYTRNLRGYKPSGMDHSYAYFPFITQDSHGYCLQCKLNMRWGSWGELSGVFFIPVRISQFKKNAWSHNAMQDSLKPRHENITVSHGYGG